eukprot:6214846-Pleurochrysis_carterae.AAC.4
MKFNITLFHKLTQSREGNCVRNFAQSDRLMPFSTIVVVSTPRTGSWAESTKVAVPRLPNEKAEHA